MTFIVRTESGESRIHAARYEYQTNPSTNQDELHIYLLNGQEANFSSTQAYDEVVKSKKFCLVKTSLSNQVTMIQPPINESIRLQKEGVMCHVYRVQKNKEKEEIQAAPGIKLNAMLDDDIAEWGEKLKGAFINAARPTESTKPLESRVQAAPPAAAPKQKGGFFGKLLGRKS